MKSATLTLGYNRATLSVRGDDTNVTSEFFIVNGYQAEERAREVAGLLEWDIPVEPTGGTAND